MANAPLRLSLLLLLLLSGCSDRASRTAELPEAIVTPHVEAKLVPGQNCVYCATFEAAWREAQKALGGNVRLANNPPMSDILNRSAVKDDLLPLQSAVCKAGFIQDGILDDIRGEMRQQFPNVEPGLSGNLATGLVVYAYLNHSLAFDVPFIRFDETPLKFPSKSGAPVPVACFGVRTADAAMSTDRIQAIREQIRIIDYRSDDDFVIALIPTNGNDELLLAKIPRPGTLKDAVKEVLNRVAHPHIARFGPRLDDNESVLVPVLELRLERIFDELVGQKLLNESHRGLILGDARQRIDFRLDEKGAKILSDAWQHYFGLDKEKTPRKMVFDKPFLLCLRNKSSARPYFAIWVENAEFMQRLDSKL